MCASRQSALGIRHSAMTMTGPQARAACVLLAAELVVDSRGSAALGRRLLCVLECAPAAGSELWVVGGWEAYENK